MGHFLRSSPFPRNRVEQAGVVKLLLLMAMEMVVVVVVLMMLMMLLLMLLLMLLSLVIRNLGRLVGGVLLWGCSSGGTLQHSLEHGGLEEEAKGRGSRGGRAFLIDRPRAKTAVVRPRRL